MKYTPLVMILLLVPLQGGQSTAEPTKPEAADWPTYNHDAKGWRFNPAERRLNVESTPKLMEKWRFPAKDSEKRIGVIHMTPVVVNGYVYFGTSTDPTFYKLTPDGRVKWTYQNVDEQGRPIKPVRGILGLPSAAPFLGSPLVTQTHVYFGDAGGYIYALDRATGQERWKINTRAEPFPGAHSSNCVFASPILADGHVIVAGGAWEHADATQQGYQCCKGRGFVVALEPKTGKIVWKYDVGPEPQAFDPPITITDSWGKHVFYYGPSTSSVWCTPSFEEETHTLYFGTDIHNSPRKPTQDNPKNYTPHSAAVIAVDSRTGKEKWVTQINPGDVWNYNLRAYDPETGLYKDQSIGDTPKLVTLTVKGKKTKAVGCGCKNGGFYLLDATTGEIIAHTPVYKGPPTDPLTSKPDPRTLAMPGPLGGLQTGCATDGKLFFTNGIDAMYLGTGERRGNAQQAPTGGRVTAISLDTSREPWRHERPKLPAVDRWKNVGDPVASGIAVADGVLFFTTTVSNKLIGLDVQTGKVLKEIDLGPVWCGPSISRGRVYVGTGNTLLSPPMDSYFPKRFDGTLYSFGLPGEDEIDRMGKGDE